MSAPGPHRRTYGSDDPSAADLAASWEASAAGFIEWARKPLNDSYWRYHRDQFLEFVGIKSLDELPASDVLSSRQIDEWLRNSSSAHKPGDADMGLADEQLPLEAPVPRPSGDDAGRTTIEPVAAAGGPALQT